MSTRRRPVAVAITGGIGAGKSTLLAALREHGAATVSSDEIVHHLLAQDDVVRDANVALLGEGPYASLLEDVSAYERGDFDEVTLPGDSVASAYRNASRFAHYAAYHQF